MDVGSQLNVVIQRSKIFLVFFLKCCSFQSIELICQMLLRHQIQIILIEEKLSHFIAVKQKSGTIMMDAKKSGNSPPSRDVHR